jgi:DNA-3-methyladenine glycosylase
VKKVLPQEFYNRDARKVARELLGKFLIRKIKNKTYAYPIIETEAYIGPHDLASHASKGRTKRTEPMFGPPGYTYVYLIYGMYHCLNVVTHREGHPAAVLIRALGDPSCSGPGKLCRTLEVSRKDNVLPVFKKSSNIWIEDRGVKISSRQISKTARIGVAYAGEWKDKKFRYVIPNASAGL